MVNTKHLGFLLLMQLLFCSGFANNTVDKRQYEVVPVLSDVPVIDGELNDAIWSKGIWQGGFIQREPLEGVNPSQNTEFQILYDQNFLYIAIKAFDSSPDSVSLRVSRRDDIDGDAVGLAVDSYFDQKTAFGFWVNAAGVKKDFIITDDGNYEDENWDPIWWVKTAKSSEGWTAEMKIPLNQFRFANIGDPIWGLQVGRYYFRKQEASYWQFIPKDASGWVHNFGEMKGLKGLTPHRQVEIAPYLVTKTESFMKEEGNPFMTGRRNNVNVGLDAKIGLTNNFILDLTVNPDFGQVEADPSIVNLTAYEIYFPEKRPFFIEGSTLFSFNTQSGDGDMASENLFYSRRIGRSPYLNRDVRDNEYVYTPDNTTILGAAKISGRNNKGLSVGIMESLTSTSWAKIDYNGTRNHELIEPLTSYFVGSLKKEYNKGNTIIKGIITSTNRQLTENTENFFHKDAFTGGINVQHFWNNKNYYVNGKFYLSNVRGTSEAILATQTSSARYFQRPGLDYEHLDSSRTSLTGHGGLLEFGKIGEGHFRFMTFISWKSPQLEINDIGYAQSVDDIFQVAWMGIRFWKPVFIFRSININLNQWTGWNFGLESAYKGGNVNLNLQFTNYWGIGFGINRNGENLSNGALWGGPSMRIPGNWNSWYNVFSDERKALVVGFGGSNVWGDNHFRTYNEFFGSLSYRPSKKLQLTISPDYSTNYKNLQYVTNTKWNNDDRYINASLNSTDYVLSFRVQYSFSPELTLQYYARPYLTSGKFTDYKMVTNPRATEYSNRYAQYSDAQLAFDEENNEYHVDENLDGINDYTFPNNNYNFIDLQSNLVVRWEYQPGSTLFFVWTLGKQNNYSNYSTSITDDVSNLFGSYPHNIFLLKFSYRFN